MRRVLWQLSVIDVAWSCNQVSNAEICPLLTMAPTSPQNIRIYVDGRRREDDTPTTFKRRASEKVIEELERH